MKILALDPAKLFGFAHSDGSSGVIDLGEERHRLFRLLDFIRDFHAKSPFETLASEDSSLGGGNNLHTLCHHAEKRGIIKLAASQLSVPCVFVHPTSLKAWAAHSGRAKKHDMKRWAKIHFGRDFDSDDECDAFMLLQYVAAGQHLRVMPKVAKKREKSRRKMEPKLF
jgi:Holliday junction resolvasome RuvABC endonuclease subunit